MGKNKRKVKLRSMQVLTDLYLILRNYYDNPHTGISMVAFTPEKVNEVADSIKDLLAL